MKRLAAEQPTRSPTGWMPAIAAGIAGGLSFDPFGLRMLIPLAPLLLFGAARRAPSPRGAFGRVLFGGFIFYFTAISWLCSLWHFNALAPVGIAFTALYMAIYPALSAWIFRRFLFVGGTVWQFAVWGGLWIFFEWFRTLGRLAMPWTLLGHAWAVWPWAIQWADCFGEIGVSAEILIVSTVVLAALDFYVGTTRWFARLGEICFSLAPATDAAQRRRNFSAFIVLTILTVATLGGSAIRAYRWENSLIKINAAEKLRVAAIQPNIDQDTKLTSYLSEDPELRGNLQERSHQLHENLIAEKVPAGTQLIVMPETTFSALDFGEDFRLHRRIETMASSSGADLLFGADRYLPPIGEKPEEIYNSSYFLLCGKPMSDAPHQDKMRLVPFGEYVPYFDLIPGFQEQIVQIASFTEGKSVTIFESHHRRFGTMICFESSFGSQARKIARAGAEFLTVITNDAWYGMSAGPAQHHNLSILRAVETRRPVIRAANTGISSIIDPAGRITATLSLGQQGVLTGEIAPQTIQTFFVRWGNSWLIGGCLLTISFAAARGAKNRGKRG